MSIIVDFNCDMGESFGMYKLGYDEEIIKYTVSRRDSDSINADFDLSDIQLPNTILLQNLTIETKIWKYREASNNQCWIEIKNNDEYYRFSDFRYLQCNITHVRRNKYIS